MSWKLEDRIVDRLDEAISEAERFLARAKLAQKALKAGGDGEDAGRAPGVPGRGGGVDRVRRMEISDQARINRVGEDSPEHSQINA